MDIEQESIDDDHQGKEVSRLDKYSINYSIEPETKRIKIDKNETSN